jgi:hypothetical protein
VLTHSEQLLNKGDKMSTGFKMGFNSDKLVAPEPVPEGLYDLVVKKITVSDSEKGTSHNYNIEFFIDSFKDPKNPTRKAMVFTLLNDSENGPGPANINDFHHACGIIMEKAGDKSNWTGEWFIEPNDEKNYKGKGKYLGTYKGPLAGRYCKAKVIVSEYQGKQSNKVQFFICAIANCSQQFPEIKHSTNIIGKG